MGQLFIQQSKIYQLDRKFATDNVGNKSEMFWDNAPSSSTGQREIIFNLKDLFQF